MKKIVCLILLIQSGFMMAQTKTVATVNGEKVVIHPNADNGITASNGFMELGGTLIKPTSLTATDVNTLAIKGLQTGATTDNIIVSDANGVLKTISGSVLSSAKDLKVINSSYTVVDTDYAIVASGITGDITITLPAAASSKGRILVINQDNVSNTSGNEVTVKFNVPVKYSDKVSKDELLAPYYSAMTGGTLKIALQSDGTNWFVISSL